MENQSQVVKKYTYGDLGPAKTRMLEILPSETVKKELSFALQQVNSNSMLLKCSKDSLLSAIINIANVGLTLNPSAKQAWLIPRWNNYKKQYEAVLDPSYMGLQHLVIQSGGVNSIVTNVVYEGDEFRLDIADNIRPVQHRPCLRKSQRGNLLGAYSLATLSDGTKQAEWIDVDSINEVRECSESYKAFAEGKIKTCPWVTNYDEMARKTCIKRIYKYLPKGDNREKLENAIELDNEEYRADFQQIQYIEDLLISANITPEEQNAIWQGRYELSKSGANQVIQKLIDAQMKDVRYNDQAPRINGKDGLAEQVIEAVEDENR